MTDSGIIAVILLCVVTFIGGCGLGQFAERKQTEIEAVRHGAGEFKTDSEGTRYFMWKENNR